MFVASLEATSGSGKRDNKSAQQKIILLFYNTLLYFFPQHITVNANDSYSQKQLSSAQEGGEKRPSKH